MKFLNEMSFISYCYNIIKIVHYITKTYTQSLTLKGRDQFLYHYINNIPRPICGCLGVNIEIGTVESIFILIYEF